MLYYLTTDPSSSVLPTLVRELISICELYHVSGGSCQDVALEAARCLGELGPIDLSVAALRGSTGNKYLRASLAFYKDDPLKQTYSKIIHMLDEFLQDSE